MKGKLLSAVVIIASILRVGYAQTPDLPGDFNLDQRLTAADIDMLTRVAATQDAWLDLTQDGQLRQDDIRWLVEGLMYTWVGDVNLDGGFNSSDYVQMFQHGEYDDALAGNSTWADGDLNGDADFNSRDLVFAFIQGWECGPREPWHPCTWETFGSGQLPEPLPGTLAWFGDLNLDEVLDERDIDFLAAAMRADDILAARPLFEQRGFDLNADGIIDEGDRDVLITELISTYVGDSNLDGQFDSGDFVLVFQGGRFETGRLASWSQGDWDGDLDFDTADFVAAFSSGPCGYECGPRAIVVVPEPCGATLGLLGLLAIGALRRAA